MRFNYFFALADFLVFAAGASSFTGSTTGAGATTGLAGENESNSTSKINVE
jgi:hypothetical protein